MIDESFIIYTHKPETNRELDNADPNKEIETIANIKSCASLCYTWKELNGESCV